MPRSSLTTVDAGGAGPPVGLEPTRSVATGVCCAGAPWLSLMVPVITAPRGIAILTPLACSFGPITIGTPGCPGRFAPKNVVTNPGFLADTSHTTGGKLAEHEAPALIGDRRAAHATHTRGHDRSPERSG